MIGDELEKAFDQGSEYFAEWMPLLWSPAGRSLVRAAAPVAGERVLDVCCGAGASALSAAESIGSTGTVDALDLSTALLEQGRQAAEQAGMTHVRFHRADVTTWSDGQGYDVVQSGFGVFFLPDMDAAGDRLVGLLRPGGRFAISTWTEDGLDEVFGPFFRAVATQRPEITGMPKPPHSVNGARLATTDAVTAWLTARGLTSPTARTHELTINTTTDAVWRFMLSAAGRALLDGLDDAAVARVRIEFGAMFGERSRTLRFRYIVGVAARTATNG